MERNKKPFWLYLNVLGLDAPLIAVIWLFLFAQTWRVNYHPWEAYTALGLAAWGFRLFDKLLTSMSKGEEQSFPHRHKLLLVRTILIVGLAALILTVLNFPLSVYYYLLFGAILAIGYFSLLIFGSQENGEISYSKHGIGAIAFTFGTALVAHAYLPNLGAQQMVLSREFLCFAMLCLLVFIAVDLWTGKSPSEEISATNEFIISVPTTLLGAAALVFAVQNDSFISRPFFYAILTGAALLQILNRSRSRFDDATIKFLASVCLIAPAVIFEAYAIAR